MRITLDANYYRTEANAEAEFALRYEALAKKCLRQGNVKLAIQAARSARRNRCSQRRYLLLANQAPQTHGKMRG